MRVLVQKCKKARCIVNNETVGKIDEGLVLFVGFTDGDSLEEIDYLCRKIVSLRIFEDENGIMNKSVLDIGGEVLAVSQFTLTASTRKGNRPSYIRAAGHELAVPMYESFCEELSKVLGKPVGKGVFGADMKVSLVNDGPVTIIIDSRIRE